MFVIFVFAFFVLGVILSPTKFEKRAVAQTNPPPTPAATEFNQAEAIAKLKEQIKGKEQEPAEKVFKNIQMLKTIPAGRLLAIMEMGYARSLGRQLHALPRAGKMGIRREKHQANRARHGGDGRRDQQFAFEKHQKLKKRKSDCQLHDLSSRTGQTGFKYADADSEK